MGFFGRKKRSQVTLDRQGRLMAPADRQTRIRAAREKTLFESRLGAARDVARAEVDKEKRGAIDKINRPSIGQMLVQGAFGRARTTNKRTRRTFSTLGSIKKLRKRINPNVIVPKRRRKQRRRNIFDDDPDDPFGLF